MPEMPEVETIARKLRRSAVGKRIAEVRLSGASLRRPVDPSLPARMQGRRVRKVHRRGKYIIVELEPRAYFLIHLGMSGRLFHLEAGADAPRHTHAVIRLSDSTQLQYRDHRRFGLLALHEVKRPGLIPEIMALGVDPLGERFSGRWLAPVLRGSRTEVKAFLLDQRKIAGLGNIYVCEALFNAGIHPVRRCHTLTAAEAERLARAVRSVLRSAVRHRGTTFSDFMDADGRPGGHQRHLRVFQREGERCRRCRTVIERLRQGNRSSFCCPGCQR